MQKHLTVLLSSWSCCILMTHVLSLSAQTGAMPPPDRVPNDETEIIVPGEPLPPAGPLRIICPQDLEIPACGSAPVPVLLPMPGILGDCAASATVVFDPPSGSLFAPGVTVVECVVSTDCDENVVCRFHVNVLRDTESPVIECPSPIVVYGGPNGIVVDYLLPTISDDADPSPTLVCKPGPGSHFAIGITEVVCTATDACGNETVCTFTVEVRQAMVQVAVRNGTARVSVEGDFGLDRADSLDDHWEPVFLGSAGEFEEATQGKSTGFYRPGLVEGAIRDSEFTGEIAYTVIGFNPVYLTEGVDFKLGHGDLETGQNAALLLSGAEGGTAVNRWSGVMNLPFPFHFFGQPFTRFCVSKNGLLTFSTEVAGQPISLFNSEPATGLPIAGLPDNTLACFAGQMFPQTEPTDGVRAWVGGKAPNRQVFIKWMHPKGAYGRTGTGMVLEESSNKIFMVDGWVQTFLEDRDTNRPNLIVGIQQNGTNVCQIPASPNVALVNNLPGAFDNDYYLFRPYIVGQPRTGQGLASYSGVDTIVQNAMRNQSFPGLQVAITRGGRLVFNKAYGFANVETGVRMQPWHRACIGSSAKLITTAGIFKLIEQGQLSGVTAVATTPELLGKDWFWAGVDDAVAANVYGQEAVEEIAKVTLQHLMTMTAVYGGSGDHRRTVDRYEGGDYLAYTTPLGIRWFMASRALRASVNGAVYVYSNNNFTQLGQIITERTGLPYETYIQQNVLSEIGPHTMRVMRDLESEETHLDARRYMFYSSGMPKEPNLYNGLLKHTTYGFLKYSEGAATGGWTSSARDLSRLLVAMDRLPTRPDILSPASLQEMERVPFPNATNGINQAYCWRAEYSDGHIEKGGNIGYGASFMRRERAPEKLTVVLVSNTDPGILPNLTVQIANQVRNVTVPPAYDLFEALPFTLD